MDAKIGCNEDQLRIFLKRAESFTSSTFTILNIQSFSSNVLEVLLAFLADPELARRGLHLHLIQHRDLVRASPWIRETTWDDQNLSNEVESGWKDDIRDVSFLSDLAIVSSCASSAGKTRFIRNHLQGLSTNYEIGSMTIHEQTTPGDMIKHLQAMFSSSKRALHISVCLGSNETISDEWATMLNSFFFSFLVLRGIFDPVTSESYSFDITEWKVFVELPVEIGTSWIERNVPILSSTGDVLDIPPDFVVDEEVRRVCTYLRAYQTGTINRKFDANSSKRIVLLMDCSGSMRGQPFQDAVSNAVSIFDSHVVQGDVSATCLSYPLILNCFIPMAGIRCYPV